MTPTAQILPKSDFVKQALVPYATAQGPLAPNSVRVRTALISLSANNQAYAIGGSFLAWWDTYPVPKDFPAPYNDSETYGILSGWGFATVEESEIAEIPTGTLIQGYFPFSSVPVDLQLKASSAPGHYLETSPHRAKLMILYQHYIVRKDTPSIQTNPEALAREALVGTLWECSYLVNRFSFAASQPIVHPGGDDQPWSAEDADLREATVLCLAGSGKTALALAYEMKKRASGTGPRSIVAVTSTAHASFVKDTQRYDTVLTYDQALSDKAAAVLEQAKSSKRIVIFDFGARGKFTPDLHAALTAADTSFTIIRVGYENKRYLPEELMNDVFGLGASLGMVQMNTSPLRAQVIKILGEAKYFEEMEASKKKFYDDGGIPGLSFKWAEGMTGPDGLEGAWDKLNEGKVPADQGIVVRP